MLAPPVVGFMEGIGINTPMLEQQAAALEEERRRKQGEDRASAGHRSRASTPPSDYEALNQFDDGVEAAAAAGLAPSAHKPPGAPPSVEPAEGGRSEVADEVLDV